MKRIFCDRCGLDITHKNRISINTDLVYIEESGESFVVDKNKKASYEYFFGKKRDMCVDCAIKAMQPPVRGNMSNPDEDNKRRKDLLNEI